MGGERIGEFPVQKREAGDHGAIEWRGAAQDEIGQFVAVGPGEDRHQPDFTGGVLVQGIARRLDGIDAGLRIERMLCFVDHQRDRSAGLLIQILQCVGKSDAPHHANLVEFERDTARTEFRQTNAP